MQGRSHGARLTGKKSAAQAGIAYPVAAVQGKIVLIAGMKLATHEIVTFIENIP